MAKFFDYRTNGLRGETLAAAWCSKDQKLAVATNGNNIQLFNEEVRAPPPAQRAS